MNKKEPLRLAAYEFLILLSIMAFVAFVFRCWIVIPILLLGLLAVLVWLFILQLRKQKSESTTTRLVKDLPNEQDVLSLAYTVILDRISDQVAIDFPGAKWVWMNPDAKNRLSSGEDTWIILNQAGGFRRAKVIVSNLKFIGIEYQTGKTETNELTDDLTFDFEDLEPETVTEPQPENFELLAYEWVDAHILELNERCNECIAKGQTEFVLNAEDLPAQKSWTNICRELQRNEFCDTECIPEGIKIKILHCMQKGK